MRPDSRVHTASENVGCRSDGDCMTRTGCMARIRGSHIADYALDTG